MPPTPDPNAALAELREFIADGASDGVIYTSLCAFLEASKGFDLHRRKDVEAVLKMVDCIRAPLPEAVALDSPGGILETTHWAKQAAARLRGGA